MTQDEFLSRSQAVQDVASLMLRAIAEALTIHGDDPKTQVIMVAGFALAVEQIDKGIDSTFKSNLLKMLQPA